MILGVLGAAILGNCALVASENAGKLEGKQREALAVAATDSLIRRASRELEKRGSGGSLQCSAEVQKEKLLSSNEAMNRAMVNIDYGFPGHPGQPGDNWRVSSVQSGNPQSFNEWFFGIS